MDAVYGKIATVRPSWHGLDNLLTEEEARDIKVIASKGGLDYKLAKFPLFTHEEPKTPKLVEHLMPTPVPNKVAIRRTDTMSALGIVGHKYHIVQPIEVVEFFRDVVENFDWTIESAGVLQEGRLYWCLARTGITFNVAKEKANTYVLLVSSCDGTLATMGMYTNVFVVCWNTLNMALTHAGKYKVSNSHKSAFDAKEMQRKLGMGWAGLWEDGLEDMRLFEEMAKYPMSENTLIDYFSHVSMKRHKYADIGEYDKIYKDVDKLIPLKPRVVTTLLDTMQNAPGQNSDGRKMTLFGALQGVTYWTDHLQGRTDGARGVGIVTDSVNTYKSSAVSLAKELIAA